MLKILLPVVLNFVARRSEFRCPWFFTPLPVVFHANHHVFSRRWPWFFALLSLVLIAVGNASFLLQNKIKTLFLHAD